MQRFRLQLRRQRQEFPVLLRVVVQRLDQAVVAVHRLVFAIAAVVAATVHILICAFHVVQVVKLTLLVEMLR